MDIYWSIRSHIEAQTCAHTQIPTPSPLASTTWNNNIHRILVHALESGTARFTLGFQYTRAHSQIYTNTLYKSKCAQTPTHSLLKSYLSHTRTPTHSVIHYMSILWTSLPWNSPYALSSGRFGRQMIRNDSKWKCTTRSPIRPLSSKPNINVLFCFFSLSAPGFSLRAQRKRLQSDENVWEWLKARGLVCKATVTDRKTSTAYTWSKVKNNMNTWH